MQLEDSVVVITGGASGLSRASAERFLSQGAKVAILDVNADAGEALVASSSGRAIYCQCDVVQESAVAAAIDNVAERFGTIHVCCNFAGIGGARRTVNRAGPHPLKDFERRIDVNLVGTFNVLRLAADRMSKNEPAGPDGERGVIINTASAAAFEGQVGQAAYSASKGGIVATTLPLARDLAPLGIRVNTIAPGLFATPLLLAAPKAVREPALAQVLFPKRLGEPGEIAHLVQFLVENAYMNGTTVRIDGGIRMG